MCLLFCQSLSEPHMAFLRHGLFWPSPGVLRGGAASGSGARGPGRPTQNRQRGVGAVLGIAGVCTVFAMVCFFAGLERVGPVRASVLSTVEPLCALLLGAA